MTPFRNEKNTNWEGAFRVPAMIRWPGHIKAGQRVQRDFLGPRLVPDTACRGRRHRRQGAPARGLAAQAGGRTYKVHLDGYNQLPYLTGQQDKSARKEFFYFNDDGQLVALRYENWKLVFCEQRDEGTLADLARAIHLPARAENVQPAHGPLRAGRHHVEHLQRLGVPPRRSSQCRRRRWWRSSSGRSRNSRRGRRRRASASTRSWRTVKRPQNG